MGSISKDDLPQFLQRQLKGIAIHGFLHQPTKQMLESARDNALESIKRYKEVKEEYRESLIVKDKCREACSKLGIEFE